MKIDSFVFPSVEEEISKIDSLKFVNGKPKIPEGWRKLLEASGIQLITNWYLVFCPQLQKILEQRTVPLACLHPTKTLKFLLNIPGEDFILTRTDILPLLENKKEVWPWIEKWKLQFENISGHEVAATMIQTCWRGYWVKNVKKNFLNYINLIWVKWK